MSDDVPEQYRPRLCHIVKWSDFQGYGFNLHAEKGRSGQYVGTIDANSPAEAAGLKEGDRIVEVNNINIGNENHQQVVKRIKSGGDETRLLVVDSDTDIWYKTNKRIIGGDLPEVRFLSAKRDMEKDDSGHEEVNGNEHIEHLHSEVGKMIVSTSSVPVHNGNTNDDDKLHRPRLCHLKLWPHFVGYGFNLHAEKDKPGQYIGLVDDNSPASTGGLRINDRIIEVNGVNIEKEKHTEVIAKIKAIHGETKLLVVSKETDNYYKKKGITVTSSMPQTDHIATPDSTSAPPPAAVVAANRPHAYEEIDAHFDLPRVSDGSDGIDLDDEQTSHGDEDDERHRESTEIGYGHEVKAELVEEEYLEISEDTLHELKSGASALSEPKHYTTATHGHQDSPSATTAQGAGNFDLNLSVAEMKERLKSKKRQDPRMNKVPFEQKFKDFQRM